MDDGLSELTELADLRGLVGGLLLAHVLLMQQRMQDVPTERMRSILDSLSSNLTAVQ